MNSLVAKIRIGFSTSILGILICFGLIDTAMSGPPPGFITEEVFRPDSAPWEGAVGIQFSDTGRMFVWERDGRVWIVDNTNPVLQPFLDINEEVGGWRDFGLLGFTLHPNFRNNGHVYLLYVVDRHHLTRCQEDPSGVGPPDCDGTYDPGTNEYFNATIGRITRYTAIKPQDDPDFSNAVTIDYNSRKVLLGETISTGCPILYQSHGTGTILFGHDGTLIAACGDGASYSSTDIGSASETYYQTALDDGIISPEENIGAYRSQLPSSLNGKLIRIDAMTGDGLASNPFFDSANPRSARSRVWALGLRNPFRFTMKPSSGFVIPDPANGNPGALYIGDVGWTKWEDLNIARTGGENFGWPAFEGMNKHDGYWNSNVENKDAPNPLFGTGGCTQEFFYFRDLIQQDTLSATPSFPNPCDAGQEIPATADLFLHSRPEIDWMHGNSTARWAAFNGDTAENPNVGLWNTENTRIVSGNPFPGNSSTGGVWYTGTDFPAEYLNTYFHGDYGGQWIRNFVMDLGTDIAQEVKEFDSSAGGVVALATHPTEGGLYFISWASYVTKVSYAPGGDLPPIAVASADPDYGYPTPPQTTLSVQFTGSNSTDPESLPLQFAWDFGDGSPISNETNPLHAYDASSGAPIERTVSLTVTDAASNTAQATLTVSVNNTLPVASIVSPLNGTRYPVGVDNVYALSADLSDSEFPVNHLSCEWVTKLHHNGHVDGYPADTNCTTSVTIAGLGCGDDDFHWEVELTVKDPAGLSDFAKVALYPDCTGTGNQAPIAVLDFANVGIGLSETIDVLQNDYDDTALDASSVSIVLPPGHGTIDYIDPVTGVITYTNNGDASPTDTFSYQVLDIEGLPSNTTAVDVTIGSDTTPPTVPSNLVATAQSIQEIGLIWAGSTDTGGSGLASYKIYRDGGTTPIATVAGTSYVDSNLIANTTYIYQVSATDVAGNESGLSDASGATTPADPGAAIISGVVKDAVTLLPIENALVTLQTTTTHASTAADGSFSIFMVTGADLKIVGAKKGFYNASVTTNSPATDVEILLAPVAIGTNANYSFASPSTCAICHPDQKSEWDNSAMANAGINTWVHDIYNGNGTPGGDGGFVYTRDSVYAGTNPDSECAACHQPELWVPGPAGLDKPFSGPLEGPDDVGYPSTATGHGISCEACHKIADVDVQNIDFPGIFPGQVTFNLPESGTQVQYGLLPDVDYNAPDTMEPSYQPQLAAEVCGSCHQDKNDINEDHTFAGVTSEPTYTEWVQSPYGDPGSASYRTCIGCHMPSSGETQICSIDPLVRDPDTVRTHAIEGTTAAYLENAVELSMQTQLVGNDLQVDVTIDNNLTGHHVPTGVTVRNMILLVEAWEEGQDPLVNPLAHTGTQTIHDLGGQGNPAQGYYAGLPGKFYAKVNHNASLQGPTFFTDATGILFDNRIPALGTDVTNYTFSVPSGSNTVHVRARLIYRRAFRFLVDAKGWTQDGHGNPLEDVAGPDFGHLMESAAVSLEPDPWNTPPSVTDPGDQTNVEGDAVSLPIVASDADSDLLTYQATGLPVNLTIDQVTGLISGTPANGAAGAYTVTVTVSDGTDSTPVQFEWIVTAANTPPSVTDPGDQTNVEGDEVSVSIVASDADSDLLTYQATGLPVNLTIDQVTGLISGTPANGAAGAYTVTVTVFDGTDSTPVQFEWIVTATPGAPDPYEVGIVSGVHNGAWTTVTLSRTYASMVVIATPVYDAASPPLVPRVRSAAGNTFEVRLARLDGSSDTVSDMDVHYFAIEEGTYTLAEHGIQAEAVKFTSTVTDYRSSWVGETRSYTQPYAAPVVLGQVTTANDSDFSVFWSRGSSRTTPPSSSRLSVGKHVAEDSDTTRADETIGYVVVEAGTGEFGSRPWLAALGDDTVQGMTNSPPYNYAIDLATASVTVASLSAMDGNHGGWAVLYGANPVQPTTLSLVIDEDMIRDSERGHTTEQVAYLVFGDVIVSNPDTTPPTVPQNLAATPVSDTRVDLNWTASTDSGSGVAIYQVYRDGDPWPIGSTTTTSYSDSDLVANTLYTYQVSAVDAAGPPNESGLSNLDSATTLAATLWSSGNIGAVSAAGSFSETGTTITLTGSGVDIWNTSDEFFFAHQSLAGNGEIIARVSSLTNTNAWAKAGVMVRETLTGGSTHAMMVITPGNGAAFQRRTSFGANSLHTAGPSVTAPYWVRLVRAGDGFTGYVSPDGATWTSVGSASIPMAGTVYVGLAVTSHNVGTLCTAEFDNVQVSVALPDSTPPAAPTGLGATSPSSSQIDLVWTDNAEGDLSSYKVYGDTQSGFVPGPGTLIASGLASSNYAHTGLVPDTAYYYVVTAVDASGNESNPSVEASATTASSVAAFQQSIASDGILSIEVEHYDANVSLGGHDWVLVSSPSGTSGGLAMESQPDSGTNNNTGYVNNSPRLDFQAQFVKTGTHYVWARMYANGGTDDSLHVGLDGNANSTADRIDSSTGRWTWTNNTMDSARATMNVTSTGLHTLNIWMREDGSTVDKIVLTTDANYTPNGTGPAESPREL